MLDGKFLDAKTREQYERWPTFHSLLFVSLGVNRKFGDLPVSVSWISFPLKELVLIADKMRERLPVHIYHQDPTMAPEGKTAVTVMLGSDYEYWKKIAGDPAVYVQKKDDIATTIARLLEQRFPGITGQVEVTDVATPLTFERYTGNWKGPFEGWLITREELPAPDIRLEQELKKYLSSLHYGEAGDALAREAPAFIHMENTLQEPYEWTRSTFAESTRVWSVVYLDALKTNLKMLLVGL